jgi:hypothetical protein
MKKAILAVMLMLALGACALPPVDPAQLSGAQYGEYPANYKEAVQSYFYSLLKDPYSAQYRYLGEPTQGYTRAAPIAGGKPNAFGYVVTVGVNAKNSYGGYVGEKIHRLILQNGQVTGEIYPNQWFTEPWYR